MYLKYFIAHLRPEIIKLVGLDWSMFEDESKAVGVADEFMAKNRVEYDWIGESPGTKDIPSKADPAKASQFFYVHFEGIRQSHSVSMETQLSMEGDANKGPLQQKALEMTASMDLAMGMNSIAGESTAAAPPQSGRSSKRHSIL